MTGECGEGPSSCGAGLPDGVSFCIGEVESGKVMMSKSIQNQSIAHYESIYKTPHDLWQLLENVVNRGLIIGMSAA